VTTTITDDEYDLCAEAGASAFFLVVASFDSEEIDVSRNSCAEGVKWLLEDYSNADLADDRDSVLSLLSNVREQRGGFFNALWDGELAEAFARADGANTRLLCHLFDQELVEASNAAEGYPMMENVPSERYDRYG